MRFHSGLYLLCLFIFFSCNNPSIVDYFGEVDPHGWAYEDSLTAEFSIEDTEHYYQLWTNLRINGDFDRSHLQLLYKVIYPDSSSKEYPVRIKLAEKSGKWLGSGLGDILTYQQKILTLQNFKQKGSYRVIIKQNMRENNWPNIVAAGVRVTKDKEIF